jgi:hypothetical protein
VCATAQVTEEEVQLACAVAQRGSSQLRALVEKLHTTTPDSRPLLVATLQRGEARQVLKDKAAQLKLEARQSAEVSVWEQHAEVQGELLSMAEDDQSELREQIKAAHAHCDCLKQEFAQVRQESESEKGLTRRGSARQLIQSRRDSMMAGLAQGLDFQRTRRIDLTDAGFGDAVDAEQALAIATACGPELDALFLPVPLAKVLAQLREACPQARCLALGGEVTAAGFEEILRQCATPDTELGAVMGHGRGLAATAIAEGVPPSSVPTLDIEPEPECPVEPEPHDDAAHATAAGHDSTTTGCYYTLDLTDLQFRHLTDAGLGASAVRWLCVSAHACA